MKKQILPLMLSTFLLSLIACQNSNNHWEDVTNLYWIDLTHSFDENTLYWPNDTNRFVHHATHFGNTPKGYFYSSFTYSAPEHGGTHLDAPIHFAAGKKTVDQLEFKQMINQAVCIPVQYKTKKNRDYQIQIADIEEFEKKHGTIQSGSMILFFTDYGKFYPNRKDYFGTDERGATGLANLHFPGISPEVAAWLIKNRAISAVGIDTPSLDYGQSSEFKTHRILMEANIPGFENLYQLEKLPQTPLLIIALPMKIRNGSGGPLRILAGWKKC